MNWGDFFAMNGYALYVWGSYGMALLALSIEITVVRRKGMAVLRRLRLARNTEDTVL
ncbi:MAG: heme exporter protein CcmD [Candidatus Nitrotoga sp.]|jgi:heme exporter protein D|nr:heme exporter protein CcmD [Candidatus Nitrotoga sp.]MBP0118911.1 heme exporter protein CcmD [Candidatus Nitrotoga sp.]MDW7535150.1 heme exporter protein CcmD [Candidatus Nitrotoga sp.]MDW7604749.1 heme exporter protein CcmD [Candidatus Nitrotoga sp.]MDW7612948.1 heme exporter protein CcmD [Candidatus Nitrotoga sp.]